MKMRINAEEMLPSGEVGYRYWLWIPTRAAKSWGTSVLNRLKIDKMYINRDIARRQMHHSKAGGYYTGLIKQEQVDNLLRYLPNAPTEVTFKVPDLNI